MRLASKTITNNKLSPKHVCLLNMLPPLKRCSTIFDYFINDIISKNEGMHLFKIVCSVFSHNKKEKIVEISVCTMGVSSAV